MSHNSAYKGNKNLKKSYEYHEYTEEELREYIKCAQDVVYFASNYVNVVHPDKGLIPIELYDYQKNLLDHFQSNRNSIVLSSRQSGKCLSGESTIMVKKTLSDSALETTLEQLYTKTISTLEDPVGTQLIGGVLLGYLPTSGELEIQTYAGHILHLHFTELRKLHLAQDVDYYISLIGRSVWVYLDEDNRCFKLVRNDS